jgi:predicted signal transduction protein with EAL and GGDEF domain
VLFTPIVAIGGTRYPPSGWRSGGLLVVIAVVLGGYVLALVEKVERQRDDAKEMLASPRRRCGTHRTDDRFAWLMPETTQEAAYLASERARRAIHETPFQIAGSLTISAGVASNQHADSPDELFSAADRALYSAKHNGRNMTFIYTQDTPPHPAYAT